jgi:hypothetical protein
MSRTEESIVRVKQRIGEALSELYLMADREMPSSGSFSKLIVRIRNPEYDSRVDEVTLAVGPVPLDDDTDPLKIPALERMAYLEVASATRDTLNESSAFVTVRTRTELLRQLKDDLLLIDQVLECLQSEALSLKRLMICSSR